MTPTYQNPVYPHDFADPFVLQHEGEFWAYCTGIQPDGRCFGILHSHDLIDWQPVGGAMEPLPGGHTCYWAPEVSYHNGLFYLYYSVGNEERMQIRVAVAVHPAGPFQDSGRGLTGEPFAIDAHLFQDRDGTRYLFYATDFLEHERVGTGTVRDILLDPYTLAGAPQPVTLPAFEWQIYDPQRAEKGGACWHTVEGSFVLYHKGLYYQMFSGGNWQNPSYGVSYATTAHLDPNGEVWEQQCDGEAVLPLLRSIPGKVIGPGHNSVVRGPDNRQRFCVYHRWAEDGSGRFMALDRLEWVGRELRVLGPSYTPQAAPLRPTFLDRFDTPRRAALGPEWECEGTGWSCESGNAVQADSGRAARARCRIGAPVFLAEVSVRALTFEGADAALGVMLMGGEVPLLACRLMPDAHAVEMRWQNGEGSHTERVPLPDTFDLAASSLLRLDVAQGRARVTLPDASFRWSGSLSGADTYHLVLFTETMSAAFGHVSLTVGWEETWEGAAPLDERGWRATGGAWQIAEQQLRYAPTDGEGRLTRGPALPSYEWVLTVRLDGDPATAPAYALLPALDEAGNGPRLTIERDGSGWAMRWQGAEGAQRYPLPPSFDPHTFQHFRLRKEGAQLSVHCAATLVAEGVVTPGPTHVGVAGFAAPLRFDLIRLTATGGAI